MRDGERGDAERNGEGVEAQQHRQADQRLSHEKQRRLNDADLAGRDRPRTCAFDRGVEIAIDDVVPGAAGAAHGEGADEEQRDMRQARPPRVSGDRRKGGRPPARNE
jgi:hypothetical protein